MLLQVRLMIAMALFGSVVSLLSSAALAHDTPPAMTASEAAATPPPAGTHAAESDPTMRPITHDRRAGLVLGVAPGIGFAGASGYPNDVKFIGNPDYYSSSSMLVGISTSYFLMGAMTDYFSFGPMVNVATFGNDTWKSTGFGIGFRVEVFPLLVFAPTFADTSVYSQLGFGSATLRLKGTSTDTDGSRTFLGIGIHHEFRAFRRFGGHATFGPFVEYNAISAQATERHWLSIGLRVAWYGGAVTNDHP